MVGPAIGALARVLVAGILGAIGTFGSGCEAVGIGGSGLAGDVPVIDLDAAIGGAGIIGDIPGGGAIILPDLGG
jgi:hypothetical protein